MVVFIEITNTILREIVALSSANNKVAGIVTLVFFGILCLLPPITTIGICIIVKMHSKNKHKEGSKIRLVHYSPVIGFFAAIYKSYKNRRNKNRGDNPHNQQLLIHSQGAFLACVINSVIVGLYFYGDNLGYILQAYGEDLGCDATCSEVNLAIAVIALAIGAFLLHLFPEILKQLIKLFGYKYKPDRWYYTLSTLTTLVKIDAIYSTLASLAQIGNYCSITEVTLSLFLIVISSILGIFDIIIKSLYILYGVKEKKKGNTQKNKAIVTSASVLLILSLPLYLLVDNEQPLNCGFECDVFENTTCTIQSDPTDNCRANANSITRLVLAILTGVLIIIVLVLVLYGYYTENKLHEVAQDTRQLEHSMITASGANPEELTGMQHEASAEEGTQSSTLHADLQTERDSDAVL